MIDSSQELAGLLPVAQAAEWVAVDTEADSLHAYPEKLCLLQVSLPGRDELIDPLAPIDLGPFFRAIAGHRLILHGADYDLRLLYRTFRFVPASVLDTMLAARLLGYAELSLEKLAGRLLGVRLEKGPQRANWALRPLTKRMAEYALNDTRHLKPMADDLEAQLRARGRLSWHAELCARLVRDCGTEQAEDANLVWRLKGSDRLDRRGLAVLRQLWHWRHHEALSAGRPPYFILAHEVLVGVARAATAGQPADDCLPVHLSPRRCQGVAHAVEQALKLPASDCPPLRRPVGRRLSRSQKDRYEELRRRRDRRARELEIDPSLIASRALLVTLAANPESAETDLMDWQRQLLA